MQINKLNQINFGMPIITEETRQLLPKKLSEQDKKNIEYVENTYPNAKLDVHQNNVTSPKTPLERGFRKLENLFDIRPNYKIDVYDMIQETPNGTHVSGASINGDLFLTDTGDMYIHSSYPVNHPKLTTTDLVKATELYDKRFRKTISKIEK